ncbi:hypothetical protein ACAW74_16365 [Fibrella sp. WM1]|uniref:beta barrel domain-containing protein n=1 Tax=Fibrella musci TaxID=3242485 RepID=UPI003522CD36
MKIGDLIYVRYVGNIRHWSRELFQAPVTWIGSQHFTVVINGQPSRFERSSLRHDNRGHNPSYQLFLTLEAYKQGTELAELRSWIDRTDFGSLPVEKQSAIKGLLAA